MCFFILLNNRPTFKQASVSNCVLVSGSCSWPTSVGHLLYNQLCWMELGLCCLVSLLTLTAIWLRNKSITDPASCFFTVPVLWISFFWRTVIFVPAAVIIMWFLTTVFLIFVKILQESSNNASNFYSCNEASLSHQSDTHTDRATAKRQKKLSMTLLVLLEVGQRGSLALWQIYWACSVLLKARWWVETSFYASTTFLILYLGLLQPCLPELGCSRGWTLCWCKLLF